MELLRSLSKFILYDFSKRMKVAFGKNATPTRQSSAVGGHFGQIHAVLAKKSGKMNSTQVNRPKE